VTSTRKTAAKSTDTAWSNDRPIRGRRQGVWED
jgi:hypothetical protein